MALSPKQIALLAAGAVKDKKAKDIVLLDIEEISVVCDYFLICTGLSSTQVKAIAENIEQKLKEQGITKLRMEGYKDAHWVLIDFGAVVVHIFQENDREFYNLERLWGDAKAVYM
ncbi:ribosome silencing factor [Phosphitispora sp. TUW77]|uniref:ribosome silencing factor n=1 Tax=Phosphitispora sp. TUW77 TaxID=3152361 RepID=UPI003AB186FB